MTLPEILSTLTSRAGGVRSVASALAVSPSSVSRWGTCVLPIPLARFDQLCDLAAASTVVRDEGRALIQARDRARIE